MDDYSDFELDGCCCCCFDFDCVDLIGGLIDERDYYYFLPVDSGEEKKNSYYYYFGDFLDDWVALGLTRVVAALGCSGSLH